MSQIGDLLSRSSCSQCGAKVFMTDEGRVACEGCRVPTEECTCDGAARPDTQLPV